MTLAGSGPEMCLARPFLAVVASGLRPSCRSVTRGRSAGGSSRSCDASPSLNAAQNGKKRVWTLSTPWASDSVVRASDWAGLGMFSGEWRFSKG
jgi:hypothetical protein